MDLLTPDDDNQELIQWHIAQNLKGFVSINDLLQSTNGLLLTGNLDFLTSKEGIFIYLREGKKERPNFVLAWGYENNNFFIYRNGYRVDFPIDGLDKCDNKISLVIGIEPTRIFMYILDKDFREKIETEEDLLQELSIRKKRLLLQLFLLIT